MGPEKGTRLRMQQRFSLPAFGQPPELLASESQLRKKRSLFLAPSLISIPHSSYSPRLFLPTSEPSSSPVTWKQNHWLLPSAQDVLLAMMADTCFTVEGPETPRVAPAVLVVTWSSPPEKEARTLAEGKGAARWEARCAGTAWPPQTQLPPVSRT